VRLSRPEPDDADPNNVAIWRNPWRGPVGRGRTTLFGSVAMLLLAACNENSVGYVEIRTFPGLSGPLYLNSAKIDTPHDGSAILQRSIGKTTLGLERNGILLPVCEFNVRTNRIITVTVLVIDRLPRCDVQN